jgi:small subunit ribosomal protein S4
MAADISITGLTDDKIKQLVVNPMNVQVSSSQVSTFTTNNPQIKEQPEIKKEVEKDPGEMKEIRIGNIQLTQFTNNTLNNPYDTPLEVEGITSIPPKSSKTFQTGGQSTVTIKVGNQTKTIELKPNEKQKIKHYYGLGERQLRRYFQIASKKAGNTGETLLQLCERRLDNVVRRAGFVRTRPQARQGIVHGHFQVNGVKVTSPSYVLRPGDVVTVRPRENLLNVYRVLSLDTATEPVDWITFDSETLRATMQGLPGPADFSLPVNVNLVTEFLSR